MLLGWKHIGWPQKAGNKTSERMKRIGRAEEMIRMREEMRKLKNMKLKPSIRVIRDNDFEEMQVRVVRRGDGLGNSSTRIRLSGQQTAA